MSKKTAIVLVSGGLDSATCLAMAKAQGYECYAISFEYGQRSSCELQAAKEITKAADVVEHKIFSLQIGELGGSALTDEHIRVPEEISTGIPATYVPARNTVF